MTLPTSWKKRRLRVPSRLVVHHGDVAKRDVEWSGPITITKPLRTVVDCSVDAVAPDIVKQAIAQGVRRGLFTRSEIRSAVKEAHA